MLIFTDLVLDSIGFFSQPRRVKKKLIALTIAATLSGANVFGSSFIVIDETVKVVFTQETIGGETVTVATVTVREVDPSSGTITVRNMVQKLIPDGADFNEVVTETTYVATSTGGGNFTLETTTKTITTPIVGGVRETPTEDTIVIDDPSPVPEASLGLPPVTELFPIDEDLDDPVVVSPL
jgi:hypothetical protein